MVAITGIFKLHNPSQKKRKVLDYAFEQYTLAIREILQQSEPLEDLYRDWGRVISKAKDGTLKMTEKYTADNIAVLLPGSGNISRSMGSQIKEGAARDISRMIASYISGEDTTGYPTVADPTPAGLGDVLRDFAQVGADLEDEDISRTRLLKRLKSDVRPILFPRARDCRLLFDRLNNRFFVFMSGVLPADNSFDCPVNIDQTNLIDINTGEVFQRKSRTSILCPIELGCNGDEWGWQYERFILPTLQGCASLKEAHLVRKGDEYFLHAAFVFDQVDPYEPQAYLGIDRGIVFSMAYGIVDLQGNVLLKHSEPDGYRNEQIRMGLKRQKKQRLGYQTTAKDFKRKALDGILHKVVNSILDQAVAYQAAIVIEDLGIQVKGKWVQSAFAKIERILEYKCALRGIPYRGGVFAAKSSMICIHCGELVQRQKESYQTVTCPACGAVEHSDEAAGVNIARRAMYKKAEWLDRGGYLGFHKSFSRELVKPR